MNSTLLKKLSRTVLSDKEASIYLYLLENRGAYPSRIAKDTHINRSTTYKTLTRLAVQGLVTEIEKGKKLFYQAEPPRKLERLAEKKAERAQDGYRQISNLIPDLEGLLTSPNKPNIRFYEGKQGVIDVYRDHIDSKKSYEMVAWANPERVRQFIPAKELVRYAKLKENAKITTRGIVPLSAKEQKYKEIVYRNVPEKYRPQMKFIPDDVFPYQAEITVYNDNKISIINLEEKNPVGTIIEDKTIHNMMRFIFELSWKAVKTD